MAAHHSARTTSKQVNIFIRRHPFVLDSTEKFTTSERRGFLRDVYDFSRALGFSKKDAKQQIIRAREMCGEEEYDTDETALENEINDAEGILDRLEDPSMQATEVPASSHTTTGSYRRSQSDSHTANTHQAARKQSPSKPLINLQKRKRYDGLIDQDSKKIQALAVAKPRSTNKALTDRSTQARSSREYKSGIASFPTSQDDQPRLPARNPSFSLRESNVSNETSRGASQLAPPQVGRKLHQDFETGSKSNPKPLTSHRNSSASIRPSSDTPATGSGAKPSEKNSETFVPPEVVAFSDDEDG